MWRLLILVMALTPAIIQAQTPIPPPTPPVQITLKWQDSRTVRLKWEGAPETACLYWQRPGYTARLVGCGASGSVDLGPGGDLLFSPDPLRGGQATLVEWGAPIAAQAIGPAVVIALPLVAAP